MSAGTAAETPAAASLAEAGRRWWLIALMGALSVIIGIAALVFPKPTLLAIGLLFGFFFVLWGLISLFAGFSDLESSTVTRVLRILVGIFAVFAGMVLIVRPGQSVETAAFALGFLFILSGMMQFAGGLAGSEHRVWNVLWGIIGIIAGVIILGSPHIGVVTLVLVVGFGLILQGVTQIGFALALRSLGKQAAA